MFKKIVFIMFLINGLSADVHFRSTTVICNNPNKLADFLSGSIMEAYEKTKTGACIPISKELRETLDREKKIQVILTKHISKYDFVGITIGNSDV